MIEINLLPEELQVTEKQITGMRVVLFIGVPVIFMLAFFWGWLHFIKLKQAEQDLKDMKAKEKKLSVEAAEVLALEKEVLTMQKKGVTVDKLNRLRTLDWIRKLMELTSAINGTKGWLTEIGLSLRGGKGEFRLRCKVVGKDRQELAKNVLHFLNHLGYVNGDKNNDFNRFWRDFIMYNPDHYYSGQKSVTKHGEDDNLVLIEDFELKLEIRPEVAKVISVN